MGLDAAYSGSQKCLSCTPGLSPITFSDRVVELVRGRKEKVQSWFMDLNLLLGYWGNTTRTYHHTAPTNSLYALHEALLMPVFYTLRAFLKATPRRYWLCGELAPECSVTMCGQ